MVSDNASSGVLVEVPEVIDFAEPYGLTTITRDLAWERRER